MREKYLATDSKYQPILRTNSLEEAERYAKIMNGKVLVNKESINK